MGSSANERIALQIDSRADLSGVQEARASITSLGAAVKAATDEQAAGQQHLTATIEQVRQAQARSNGDFEKFKTELASIVQEENALAAAAAKATTELQKQAATPAAGRAPTLAGPSGPQLGPGLPGTPSGGGANRAIGLAEIAAYRMDAERSLAATASAATTTTKSLEGIPPGARRAGNSLNLMAASAASGTGSITGLGTAAGNVVEEFAKMKGATQQTAAGLGVAIAGLGVMVALLLEAKDKLDINKAPEGKLAGSVDAHLKNLTTEKEVKEEIARIDQRQVALAEGMHRGDEKALQASVNLDASKAAAQARLIAIGGEDRDRNLRSVAIEAAAHTTAAGKYRGQLAVIASEQKEAIRTRELTESAANLRAATQRRELDKAGNDQLVGLRNALGAAADASTQGEHEQKRRAIMRQSADALRANDLLVQSEKTRLEAAFAINAARDYAIAQLKQEQAISLATSAATRASESEDPRVAQQGKLALIDLEYAADVKLLGVTEALALAEQKRQRLQRDSIQGGLAGYGALSNAVKTHSGVVGAMAKAAADAVRLHEIYVAGKKALIMAKIEGAASIASFASGNFWGGALHAAAAAGYGAAAVAAGVEAAGVVSGGGGGGSGGNGNGLGESGSFQARDGGGANGAQIINLYTVNPFSRETISVVSYELGRAGVLKRPIQVPPTTGILGAA